MAGDYDLETNVRAYRRWASFYDAVYTGLLAHARRDAVAAAVVCGNEVLEVGVGTGLSLPEYPAHCHVSGCDLSEPMLAKAFEKIERHGLTNVRGLSVMDACHLGFPDQAFDAVVAQFLLTLVPNPEQALDEFARVLRPGGEIIIANHIGAESGPMATFEKAVAPLARTLGWRAEFPLQRIRDWAAARGFTLISARKVKPLGYFMVIRLKRLAPH
ncbi:MAG: class I SAM-dependent methyltransferase [Proteobacteria bacterium]|nr:class I SAM-dependent methyltransferase [Pseudomonadota bacterium]